MYDCWRQGGQNEHSGWLARFTAQGIAGGGHAAAGWRGGSEPLLEKLVETVQVGRSVVVKTMDSVQIEGKLLAISADSITVRSDSQPLVLKREAVFRVRYANIHGDWRRHRSRWLCVVREGQLQSPIRCPCAGGRNIRHRPRRCGRRRAAHRPAALRGIWRFEDNRGQYTQTPNLFLRVLWPSAVTLEGLRSLEIEPPPRRPWRGGTPEP